MAQVPRALTIAGSDSGGGAGIQADLKTFLAARTYGMSAVTALTAQNTLGVEDVYPVPPPFVAKQIDVVVTDIGVDAVKTGMLVDESIIDVVVDRIRRHKIRRLVVDPVMVAKSGDVLLSLDARKALIERLLPLALIATPNLLEAGRILDRPVVDVEDMEQAAKDLHALGVRFPVVKGGHLEHRQEALDVVYDGNKFHHLRAPRTLTRNTHGTGCTLSASICAALAKGAEPLDAIRFGKEFVTEALNASLSVGHGHGPTNPGRLVLPTFTFFGGGTD